MKEKRSKCNRLPT